MCPVWFNADFSVMRDKQEHLEQEVLQYREQVSALQDRLDSVTKVRDEELNNMLLNSCSTHQSLICYLCAILFLTHILTHFSSSLSSLFQEFDMSVEELSETLLQIKAFRMQQESRLGLPFLWADGKVEDSPRELATIQASHAETVLELQKTRHLLLLEHRISKDLQVHTHIHTINTPVKNMNTSHHCDQH